MQGLWRWYSGVQTFSIRLFYCPKRVLNTKLWGTFHAG